MMRRAFADDLPDLAEQFGIRPADLEDMWPDEVYRLVGIVRARRKHPAR